MSHRSAAFAAVATDVTAAKAAVSARLLTFPASMIILLRPTAILGSSFRDEQLARERGQRLAPLIGDADAVAEAHSEILQEQGRDDVERHPRLTAQRIAGPDRTDE